MPRKASPAKVPLDKGQSKKSRKSNSSSSLKPVSSLKLKSSSKSASSLHGKKKNKATKNKGNDTKVDHVSKPKD